MKRPDRKASCPRPEAALHALGALEPAEAAALDAHLHDCPLCRAEMASLARTAALLGGLAAEVDPPEGLRARVLETTRRAATPVADLVSRMTGGETRAAGDGPGFSIVRSGDGGWRDTGVPGVALRSLFVDQANDRITMLVRMEPGASYPSHRHGGVEECYVLEGDLAGPGFEMRSGDYQRLDGGTVHGDQFTRGGCLLFIVSSLHDELLGARA